MAQKKEIYPVELTKKEEDLVLKLYKGSKKDKSDKLPISKIVDRFKTKYPNSKRQVMRVLHNNDLKAYEKSSLV